MAPNAKEDELRPDVQVHEKLIAPQAGPWMQKVVYKNLITFGYWHVAAIYGIYLCFTSAKWATLIFSK